MGGCVTMGNINDNEARRIADARTKAILEEVYGKSVGLLCGTLSNTLSSKPNREDG